MLLIELWGNGLARLARPPSPCGLRWTAFARRMARHQKLALAYRRAKDGGLEQRRLEPHRQLAQVGRGSSRDVALLRRLAVDTASLALFGDDAAEARRLRIPLRYRLVIVEAHKIEADQRRLERRRIDVDGSARRRLAI